MQPGAAFIYLQDSLRNSTHQFSGVIGGGLCLRDWDVKRLGFAVEPTKRGVQRLHVGEAEGSGIRGRHRHSG